MAKRKSIHKKRLLIIGFKAMLFFVLILTMGKTAAADQTDSGTEFHSLHDYGQYIQGIGTGYTGTATDIEIYLAMHGQTESSVHVDLVDFGTSPCTEPGYNSPCTVATVYHSDSMALSSTDGNKDFIFTTPPTLDNTHYYAIQFGGGWNSAIAAKGCNTDCFGADGYASQRYFGNGVLVEGHQVDAYFRINAIPGPSCTDGILNQDETAIDSGGVCHTHIVSFTPADSATPISSPVTFTLQVQVDPVDIGSITGIKVTLHNIDQNVLLLNAFSPNDIYLLDNVALTAGAFSYTSPPTPLGDGNYRIDVSLVRSYFGGIIENPFSSINVEESHSFVVGAPTFIGNLQNNIFKETNDITGAIGGGQTASELAATCVPLGDFDIIQCMHFLFVPDSKALNDTFNAAKDAILIRVPWGYFTRIFNMLSNPATSGLPEVSATFPVGPSGGDTMTVGFNPGDMLAGASTLVDSIHDPLDSGVTFRGTFKPMIQMGVALMVLFTIIADLVGSHKHHVSVSRPKGKLS